MIEIWSNLGYSLIKEGFFFICTECNYINKTTISTVIEGSDSSRRVWIFCLWDFERWQDYDKVVS